MYYCRFADLLTDADFCEMSIPFTADRRIILPGAFSADIDIPNESVARSVRQIIPQKTICHVYRNDLVIGSYIIWSKKYNSSRGKVTATIQGATLESYLYHRILHSDLSYVATDQLTIAAGLLAEAQDTGLSPYGSSSDLGINPVFETGLSGILRDRSYLYSDTRYVGELLEELANVDAGFEYIIHTYELSGSRYRDMHLSYDKLVGSASEFILEEPGDILDWDILFDGTQGGTVFYARGQTTAPSVGQGQEPVVSSPAMSTDFLDNGWPVLEYVYDYQNASETGTLNAYAAWWAKNRGGSVIIPNFKVRAASMFLHGFSPFSLGSQFTVVMNNPLFPLVNGSPTFISQSRAVGFQLKVDQNETEEMDIIVETTFDPTDVQ